MDALPALFSDLALILITAGITTIIFKWLKQPLVLGYIVAGFLVGPHFYLFPGLTDTTNIEVWGKIGVVFLLFALGLEFSFKKLKVLGATGAVTAITELVIMFTVGFTIGKLMDWQDMNCVFLGCMLAISSTAIIIKALDDLGMKKNKFANIVFGVLVVEDLVAVLLLVVLSTVSVSKQFNGAELAFSLVKLVFFLVIWFIVGIYLIPTILRKARKLMTEETLLIFAIGLCFGMVVFATYVGFSEALGAFIMGSILAETIEADQIHKLVTPIKNLFSAIFFVTVGMMVNPEIIVQYAVPIIIISLAIMFVKSFSATVGILISGQNLKTSMQAGFCFSQIGEFSFIIATLGVSYKVIDPWLYPVIVSVSVITTFFTPFMIKLSNPIYEKVYPRIPQKIKVILGRYSSGSQNIENENIVKTYIKSQISTLIIYGSILTAILLLSKMLLRPFVRNVFTSMEIGMTWANIAGAAVTLIIMAPFIKALVSRKNSSVTVKQLLATKKLNHGILLSVGFLKYIAAIFLMSSVVVSYLNLAIGYLIAIAFAALYFIRYSKKVSSFYQQIEGRFMKNLNQRQDEQRKRSAVLVPEDMSQNFHLEEMVVSSNSGLIGAPLKELHLREDYNINIVRIIRGRQRINLPDRHSVLYPGDKITILGKDEDVAKLKPMIEIDDELIAAKAGEHPMGLYSIELTEGHQFIGKTISEADIRKQYEALVIAIERNDEVLMNPKSSTGMESGDLIWVVCEKSGFKELSVE